MCSDSSVHTWIFNINTSKPWNLQYPQILKEQKLSKTSLLYLVEYLVHDEISVSYNIFFMKLLRGFIFISYQDMLKNLEDNRKSGSPDDISPDQEGPVQQGFPRGQVYYASSAKQVRIFQTSAKIPAKQSWCRMFLARTFFYRICYFVDKWCAKYCLFWHCQILFHWICVMKGIYYIFGLMTLKCSSEVYMYPLWRIFSSFF